MTKSTYNENLSTHTADMPEPDNDALGYSRRLRDRIRNEIEISGGEISFRRYMEMALYEPGLGYYSGGARKFGKDGDFTTAPEMSPLYSRCIARQCKEILDNTGGGVILELGAGTGVMAATVLEELNRLQHLPDKYLILETSADLRQRQQQLLAAEHPRYLDNIQWLDYLPSEPIRGAILASEVLDALPVRRIEFSDQGIRELCVSVQGGEFVTVGSVPDKGVSVFAGKLQKYFSAEYTGTYTTEINPELEAWIASFADTLIQGVMLIVDYGYPRKEYYHPQRTAGTLKCHYRHRVHDDPFLYPGLQDITAALDFTGVAEAAVDSGLDVLGYTTQAHFLAACGLGEMLSEAQHDDFHFLQLSQQAKLLTLPGEMGEQFKVMALGQNYGSQLRGFGIQDMRSRL